MWSLSFLTVSSLALIQSFVVGLTLPSNKAQIQRMKRSVNAQTQQELARVLGGDATIFGPTDANWGDATVRYMQNIKPRVLLSVRPRREGDVAKIVSLVFISITSDILKPRRFDMPIITISRFMRSPVAMP